MGEFDLVFDAREAITRHQPLNPLLIRASHCIERTALTKWLFTSAMKRFHMQIELMDIDHWTQFPLICRSEQLFSDKDRFLVSVVNSLRLRLCLTDS